VSIGLPVYNGERFLAQAIDSLLQQSFSDFEIIICDNASEDATEEICRSYADKDSRIQYFRNQTNLGAFANAKRTFELSRAPYFKWAFHDDVCGPGFLEKCVDVLDRFPDVVLCYPRSGFIDEHGKLIADYEAGCNLRSPDVTNRVSRFFAECSNDGHPVLGVLRHDALVHTSLIGPYPASDMVLLLQLALMGKIYEIPEQLFFCREHAGRSCRRNRTYADLATWHNPSRKIRWQLPRWRLAFEFFRCISHARLGLRQSISCYISILKWCRWHYRPFIRDLINVSHNRLSGQTRMLNPDTSS
jgi:glycosyltransferase involved in cell wall biosynthesis